MRTGLPLHHYFSAPKLRWLLDSEPDLQDRADRGELLFGTMDSWITWNLTGGAGIDGPASNSRSILPAAGRSCFRAASGSTRPTTATISWSLA